jgi:hypothetical protein
MMALENLIKDDYLSKKALADIETANNLRAKKIADR